MEQTERRAPNRAATVRPVTPRQRAARAARNGGEPTLEFAERVPYDAYVHASTLHQSAAPLSTDPGRDVLPDGQPDHGAVLRAHLPRAARDPAAAARGPGLGRAGPAAPGRAAPGGAQRGLAGPALDDPGRLQPVPQPARRGLRLPVGHVPAAGVPARAARPGADPAVPPAGRGVRRAARRPGHAEPLGRRARPARPARLRPPRRPAGPGRRRRSTSRSRRSRRPGCGSTPTPARRTTCACSARR